jgi:hypothetical protein
MAGSSVEALEALALPAVHSRIGLRPMDLAVTPNPSELA